ncbi:MAG: hypothetical protein OXC31_11895, partial [Spirochaetaceae bacterium]|nr:hypothetical protein [Spirochaetaceae bacterium]
FPGPGADARVRSRLTYRITPRLQAGIEANPLSTRERANPLVNWLAVPESARMPAVIIGTSSDRIGTPGGQSIYATASKNLKRETKLPIAPYFGVAYGTHQDSLRMIGGINVGFTESLGSMVIFDGFNVHPLVTFGHGRHVFTFLLVRSRKPGLSYSISF